MDSSEQLLKRARAYDQEALGRLYDRYAPRIYAYLYRRVRSVQLAEDLTGDVFVRMLEALRQQRMRHDALQAWLYRIAHNLVVDHYRRQQPDPLPARELVAEEVLARGGSGLEPAGASPARLEVEATLFHEGLGSALHELTADQQQVLALRFGQELTARETARAMQKSVGAVEALQRRALGALRRILGGEGP